MPSQLQVPATLPPVNDPQEALNRRLAGPPSQPLPGIEPCLSGRPARGVLSVPSELMCKKSVITEVMTAGNNRLRYSGLCRGVDRQMGTSVSE